MLHFTNTLEIDRPIDDVFDYLEDFTNVPQWNYWVQRVEQISDGPIGVGTVFHQTRRDDQQRYQLTAHERPHTLTVSTLPEQRPAFTRSLRLEPRGAATVLVDTWQLDSGHPPLVQRLAAGRVRQAVAGNLNCLEQLLERGTTVLPDGRTIRRNLTTRDLGGVVVDALADPDLVDEPGVRGVVELDRGSAGGENRDMASTLLMVLELPQTEHVAVRPHRRHRHT